MLKPVFVAHRGYAAAYPENTLLALDAAWQSGARFVEVDIQLSADKVPVLFHDRDLLRLCQQPGAIQDYTFEQLKQFSLANTEKFSSQFADNKITSLQEFIEYLEAHPDLSAFIELKRSMIDYFGDELVLEIILPLFKELKNKISFISYNQAILKKIENQSGYTTGVVIDEWKDYLPESNWQPEWLFCSAEGLPENDQELDIESKIVIFEVSDIELADKLLARGIHYLETFHIREMIQAFAEESAG
jgi:glycerophosphoryl diester phosphodiesterase